MKTSTGKKMLAVFAYALSMLTAAGGIGGTLALAEMGCYTESAETFQQKNLERDLFRDINNLNAEFENLKSEGFFEETISQQRKQALYSDFMREYAPERTNFFFKIYDAEDNLLLSSYDADYQAFRTETFYDEIRNEEEKIMNEADFNYFQQNFEGEYSAQQMIVPRGEPAPVLPDATDSVPATEPETIPETESITETVVTETVPETQPITEVETVQDSLSLVAHAEANIREVYVSDFSLDERIQITEALHLDYYQPDDETLWIDTGNGSVLFEDYFQQIINSKPNFELINQNGWHYTIDTHQNPPVLMSIVDYILSYPEEFNANLLTEETGTGEYYDIYYDVKIYSTENPVSYYITGYVQSNFTADDSYRKNETYTSLAYQYRYVIPAVGIVSGILLLISLIYLIRSAGFHKNKEYPEASIFEKIPYDLFTAFLIGISVLLLYFDDEVVNYSSTAITIFIITVSCLIWGLLLLWWLMSTAVRIRTKTILENNLITRILKLLKKLLRNGKNKISGFLQMLPFVWKAVLLTLGYLFFDFITTLLIHDRADIGLFLKLLIWTVTILGAAAVVYQLHLLQKGGQHLAEGNLEEKIPEEKLFFSFREHAKNLNSIGEGMNKAVSERLKSEMFRTELIANVSHDIRTPLTSIINYTDLLSKLQIQDETAQEYIAVLSRQSARLRKLTEDVLEASKASTGSMKVEKESMDLNVLLQQIEGEYAEKFESRNLIYISTLPETPLMISADGRLLWRAMDNLFNNIFKYAMPNTRVYLNAVSEKNQICITLRNISSVQLNISSEALMERFVRGDRSRNTEGSGLGLSIAQSLINLQGGTMQLEIDGDLFKVILTFPPEQLTGI